MDNCLAADSWISSTHFIHKHGIDGNSGQLCCCSRSSWLKGQHTLIQHALFLLPFWYLIVGVAGKKPAFVHLYNLYLCHHHVQSVIFHVSRKSSCCCVFRFQSLSGNLYFLDLHNFTHPQKIQSNESLGVWEPLILEHLPAPSAKRSCTQWVTESTVTSLQQHDVAQKCLVSIA